jgi:hypothetical protein
MPSCGVILLVGLLGLRLLGTGWLERSLPELALGVFFIAGSTGFGCEVVGRELGSDHSWAGVLSLSSMVAYRVPSLAMGLFTWRVFRAQQPWAAVIFAGIVGIQSAAVFSDLLRSEYTPGQGWSFWAGVSASGLVCAWGTIESNLYYRIALRRVALGLASPVTTNRFLLWSLWSGATCGILVVKSFVLATWGVSTDFTAFRIVLVMLQVTLGLACVTAMGLTFYPPTAYRRWIQARAELRAQQSES